MYVRPLLQPNSKYRKRKKDTRVYPSSALEEARDTTATPIKAAKNKAIGYPNKDPSLPAFLPFLRG
jgi:hypothetical protein